MTRRSTAFVLAYHGCDESVGQDVLSRVSELQPSEKDYDWLGPGVYFWENDPVRALEWAQDKAKRNPSLKQFVVGAVIDLGHCLDLTLRENLELLRLGFEDLKNSSRKTGTPLPKNKDQSGIRGPDKLLRFRDCAVIRRVHTYRTLFGLPAFDSVRGLFVEGKPVYPGARFHEKTHTQIAVLNPEAIKEVFLPRL